MKLPKEFDARTAWPHCSTIGRILGQLLPVCIAWFSVFVYLIFKVLMLCSFIWKMLDQLQNDRSGKKNVFFSFSWILSK
jgi:hypothetical protein